MKNTAKNLSERLPEIVKIIGTYNFTGATLFKGFVPKNEKQFNLLLTPSESNHGSNLFDSIDDVEQAIQKIMGCEIYAMTQQNMRPYYYTKLDESNSVDLLNVDAKQKISSVFPQWTFVDIDYKSEYFVPEFSDDEILVEQTKEEISKKNSASEQDVNEKLLSKSSLFKPEVSNNKTCVKPTNLEKSLDEKLYTSIKNLGYEQKQLLLTQLLSKEFSKQSDINTKKINKKLL